MAQYSSAQSRLSPLANAYHRQLGALKGLEVDFLTITCNEKLRPRPSPIARPWPAAPRLNAEIGDVLAHSQPEGRSLMRRGMPLVGTLFSVEPCRSLIPVASRPRPSIPPTTVLRADLHPTRTNHTSPLSVRRPKKKTMVSIVNLIESTDGEVRSTSRHTMPQPQECPEPRPEGQPQNKVAIMKDPHAFLPLDKTLEQAAHILLLTPVIAPEELEASPGRDPFEDLGRAIAARRAGVKHVPFSARNGITSTHADFIRTAGAVIFVVSGPPRFGQVDQLELARAVRRLSRDKPLVLVVIACRDGDLAQDIDDFSVVVRMSELSPSNVTSLATLVSDGDHQTSNQPVQQTATPREI
ncbi:hypothetical protein Micbo1qcDRAFT_160966 [Microdochium bolleyi]|uniref:Uncharacterized protein n=1 Tax=Microdochium bolleyi TaxID=196109 RepID=A0A136J7A1_9PEZI|nr:hypothetical protein Micbo1qcDRAFT_160966 [Microdochium bolleyi]